MPITNGNGLECIEEASSTSSSDGADFSSELCKYDKSELSFTASTTDCVNLQNASINIDNSNDVVIGSVTHFHGPVSIHQVQSEVSVERREGGGTEGRLVKSESVSSEKSCSGDDEENVSKTLRTSLFVIMSFLIIAALITLVAYFTATASEPALPGPDGDLGAHRLINRDEWGGRPPESTRPLTPPVQYVIISHSAGIFCSTTLECAPIVRDIQTLHVAQNGSPDIGYNFLIGGDGNIYVGRGWNVRNFHMDSSIGICFLGNYVFDSLTKSMIEAAQMLLERGLTANILSKEYKLVGHNQTYVTMSPGENVYKVIKEWKHFYPGQIDN